MKVRSEMSQAQNNEMLWADLAHKLSDQVVIPLNTYQAQFPEMRVSWVDHIQWVSTVPPINIYMTWFPWALGWSNRSAEFEDQWVVWNLCQVRSDRGIKLKEADADQNQGQLGKCNWGVEIFGYVQTYFWGNYRQHLLKSQWWNDKTSACLRKVCDKLLLFSEQDWQAGAEAFYINVPSMKQINMWIIIIFISEKDWQEGAEADRLWRGETLGAADAKQPKQKWGKVRPGKGTLFRSLFVSKIKTEKFNFQNWFIKILTLSQTENRCWSYYLNFL